MPSRAAIAFHSLLLAVVDADDDGDATMVMAASLLVAVVALAAVAAGVCGFIVLGGVGRVLGAALVALFTKRHSAPEIGDVASVTIAAMLLDVVSAIPTAIGLAPMFAVSCGTVLSTVKGALIVISVCGSSGLDASSLA
jgi:hypothetical protein